MAVDYFLKIAEIPGESRDLVHKNEIEIDNWSFGAYQAGKSGHGQGATVGRVSPMDFRIIKKIDASSPKLMQACAAGTHFPEAVLIARKSGDTPQEYMKITFRDLIVSSFHTLGSATSDIIPRDEIAFNFTEMFMEYREQLATGGLGGRVAAGWDMKRNRESTGGSAMAGGGTGAPAAKSDPGNQGIAAASPSAKPGSGPRRV
jgi:type VI secretion system secreted protein Hcp